MVHTVDEREKRCRDALASVAASRRGIESGDIEPILYAIAVLKDDGPWDVPPEKVIRLVLDVRYGRLSPGGAYLCLFRGDYSEQEI